MRKCIEYVNDAIQAQQERMFEWTIRIAMWPEKK